MLDAVIARIAQNNQISVESLYQHLQSTGMSKADYRAEIRDQLALQKIQQQEVMGRVTVSPEEVATFMKSKVWQANEDKEYNLEDILIPVSDNPSSNEIATAKQHAEAVLGKLRSGESFQQVAQSESGEAHALQGGDLGWRKLPEIPSVFADRVTAMKIKEIAGPIQAPNGFHLIRLAGVRAAQSKTPAPTKKQVEELLLQRKLEENAQVWVSRLRGQAFIVTNPTS
jgi:peptidyl-prolyl cis-trans isomerase SurA